MGKRLIIIWIFLPNLLLHSQTTAYNEQELSIDSLQKLARNSFYQLQYGEGIKYLMQALKIVEKTNDRTKEAAIYNDLGSNYSELGDLSKGLEFHYKALRISEELGDKNEMAAAYQCVGVTFDDLKDDSLALKNYSEALKIHMESGNKFKYAQSNNAIAYVYVRQGRYSEALKIYKESLEIYQAPDAPVWGRPFTYSIIGDVHEGLGDSALNKGNKIVARAYFEEALKDHDLALTEYKRLDIPAGYSQQYYYIGVINLKLNRIAKAKKDLQTHFQLIIKTGNKWAIADTYLALSKIDSLEGNYENAYRHFRLSALYRDSVFNSEQSRKIALYKTQYEIEKKEEEIKLLAAENKLKTSVAEKQKQQKSFAYAAIVFVILMGGYGFYRYRIQKKSEVEKAKLKDRLHISQGLHDDIGSTLSSISVYTQVAQKLSEKNNKAELSEMLGKINVTSSEMISEMNDIVWAIHPKNDSMEKIILRMESYARPMLITRNIDFKLEYDPAVLTTHLDMEKRKNFYLVFKEAVNNAFKYSGCSEITSRIANPKERLEILITDNGVGFDVQQQMTGHKLTLSGNGLRNMKMRAEEMKGELEIKSSVGDGTAVRLSIPLP